MKVGIPIRCNANLFEEFGQWGFRFIFYAAKISVKMKQRLILHCKNAKMQIMMHGILFRLNMNQTIGVFFKRTINVMLSFSFH